MRITSTENREDDMTAPIEANRSSADRTAARVARIVIIGAALVEAIIIGLGIFSSHGHGVR
jgi:hypothetical protein